MLRKFLSVAAAALLISVILLTPASSADTGEATILSGTHRSWSVEMDEWFTLSYSIETTDGSEINVMVIPAINYTDYLEGKDYVAVSGTVVKNTTNTSMDVRLRPGIYYVVVEANDGGKANETTISYRIDALAPGKPASSLSLVLGVGSLILMGIVLYLFIDIRTKARK